MHPDQILRKEGAQVGDWLILTKPLGIGTITTAIKRGEADHAHVDRAIAGMAHLNKTASETVQEFNASQKLVHAITDITGYSLLGHGHEMAHLSGVDFEIIFDQLQWYDGARKYAQADIFPGGMHRNREYFQEWVQLDAELTEWQEYLLYDPQTSGGLLISVDGEHGQSLLEDLISAGEHAVHVGTVTSGNGRLRIK